MANSSLNSSSLPRQSTPFIGRSEELTELALRLEDPACQLLTLVGPGGIGKTRLAVQAAAEKVSHFAHSVHFMGLSSCRSPHLSPAIIPITLLVSHDLPSS